MHPPASLCAEAVQMTTGTEHLLLFFLPPSSYFPLFKLISPLAVISRLEPALSARCSYFLACCEFAAALFFPCCLFFFFSQGNAPSHFSPLQLLGYGASIPAGRTQPSYCGVLPGVGSDPNGSELAIRGGCKLMRQETA